MQYEIQTIWKRKWYEVDFQIKNEIFFKLEVWDKRDTYMCRMNSKVSIKNIGNRFTGTSQSL